MDQNYAWIVAGVVVNAIVWNGNTDPDTGGLVVPDGVTLIPFGDSGAWIGWGWDGSEFTPPA